MSQRAIMWFRRDLRITDHPALLKASELGEVVPLFILDEKLIKSAGPKRLSYLAQSLRKLDESLGNKLNVAVGPVIEVLKRYQSHFSADSIHISEEFEPYGAKRDAQLISAGIKLVKTGHPYAVAPGAVRKPTDGTPYKVYTPFYRAWILNQIPKPYPKPTNLKLVDPIDRNFPDWPAPKDSAIFPAGEQAAHARFKKFSESALSRYDEARNLAGIDGTSKMSAHLKWGEIHPRTLLQKLNQTKAHEVYRKEIAWREFYADVLFHNPQTDWDYYAAQFAKMKYDQPGEKFKAWCEGKTGYPFVDAAMRQLLVEGWMHNRTRMVVASFLVKDLHIEWQHGAKHFMEHLVDFDMASNSHGWQWTAGCGTDASPYYRVFNPIEQGKKFDENGDYVRKYVPELSHLQGIEIHEPWLVLDGYSNGYPTQIVDHAKERIESLARLEEIKMRKPELPKK